jgi:hypothetical protein
MYIAKFKRLAYDILGNKCACCGETNPVFLSLDHINNDGYIDRVLHGRRTVKNIIKKSLVVIIQINFNYYV